MPDWLLYLILLGSGLAAGALNVVAGGGSFLTLPVLIFLGLPPGVANGTNRIGIVLQNAGAVWGFHRHRVLAWPWALKASVPACLGSLLGTWAALMVSDEAFKKILAFLMVGVSLWTLLAPMEAGAEPKPASAPRKVALALAFFVVGVYGGFVQAGVGFLILAATSFAGFDLVRGNAVKVFSILLFTVLSLALFAWSGKVDWPVGLVLAVGYVIGGLVGVHLTVLKGHRWVRGVVTVAVIAFAVKLWIG
jgi:uncharacterized membrane protein YfcA